MRILVDADSMQRRLRQILVKAAERHRLPIVFVANSAVPVPEGDTVEAIVAEDADEWLVEHAVSGDLAITHDIPLAARLVAGGLEVITDRGELLTRENIAVRSSERDLATAMREAGIIDSRGGSFGPREIQAFANALDRALTSRKNAGGAVENAE